MRTCITRVVGSNSCPRLVILPAKRAPSRPGSVTKAGCPTRSFARSSWRTEASIHTFDRSPMTNGHRSRLDRLAGRDVLLEDVAVGRREDRAPRPRFRLCGWPADRPERADRLRGDRVPRSTSISAFLTAACARHQILLRLLDLLHGAGLQLQQPLRAIAIALCLRRGGFGAIAVRTPPRDIARANRALRRRGSAPASAPCGRDRPGPRRPPRPSPCVRTPTRQVRSSASAMRPFTRSMSGSCESAAACVSIIAAVC